MCSVTFVDLKCDTRKRKFRHLAGGNTQTLMSAEFEMKVKPASPTGKITIQVDLLLLQLNFAANCNQIFLFLVKPRYEIRCDHKAGAYFYSI
jgi:hypothetical protein